MPEYIGGEDRDGAVLRASSSAGLDLQPLLDHITVLAGEIVSAQRDLAERDARIKALEVELAADRRKHAEAPKVLPPLPFRCLPIMLLRGLSSNFCVAV